MESAKCAENVKHCNATEDALRQLMEKQCPATCGKCASSGVCKDLDAGFCEQLGKDLCRDYEYRDWMLIACMKTCDNCNGSSYRFWPFAEYAQ